MAEARPYCVEILYWLPRLGGRYEYVKVERFESALLAARYRAQALHRPPVPPDATDVEVGEIRGPDLAREEVGVVPPPAALKEAMGRLAGRLKARGV
jgi:hypothetical protein